MQLAAASFEVQAFGTWQFCTRIPGPWYVYCRKLTHPEIQDVGLCTSGREEAGTSQRAAGG